MISLIKRFRSDRKGTVAIIFGLSVIPMVGLTGMGIDYTMAGRRQTQLNAIADAAALSTTTPAAMTLTGSAAQTNAINMFNSQAATIGGVTITNLTITVTPAGAPTSTRTTTVNYTAKSQNAFGSLLHMPTMTIGSTSAAMNTIPPNIDFYLLLDTSPSMAIPATQDGINQMVAATPAQGGCAFACHQSNPTGGDVAGNPAGWDNYALARSKNITLRMDLVQQAAANLFNTAQSTQTINGAVYRAATYTFDQSFKTITNLTTNLSQAASDAASKVQLLEVYSNSYLTKNNNNNDEDTQFDQAMANSAYLPNPGNGTKAAGDTPQEVLMIVTDGVIDEAYPGFGPTNMTNGGRTITMPGYQTDYCTPLKARGIRIAILYTTYYPLPTNSFYNTYVSPWQTQIPTYLKNCASPGLFTEVSTGGDISGAMVALFNSAVTTAHLTK